MQGSIGNNSDIKVVRFQLEISPERYLKYYKGHVKSVIAWSETGLKVQFPAKLLTPYVTHTGIHGKFKLKYTKHGKVVELVKER